LRGTWELSSLLKHLFFSCFLLCDVMTDGDVLIWLAIGVKKRNDGGIHPVDAAILRAIAQLALPNSTGANGGPNTTDELLRVKTGINDPMNCG